MSKTACKAPRHLRIATRRWFESVVSGYELEEHHRKLLLAACESWDRAVAAREAIQENGMIFVDYRGQPKARPEIRIEKESKQLFARLVRELGLDVEGPEESKRPAAIVGRAR